MTTDEYKRFCGPAALASACGASRREAAELLEDTPTRKKSKRGAWTSIYSIGEALGLKVEKVNLPKKERKLFTAKGHYLGVKGECPTLARWLRENPTGEAVLRASHHFVHVKDGVVVESNGWEPRRGRVTHCIWIKKEDA